ncbi:hypothetical protein Clacol_009902 [Clathrus columnatus]|uniref:Uncharacterized protein n=1 Tax=Clathrus columnatus TaxID=1419009 RepID=A0AAV5AS92_9AGAM|nr:hypothetical protein Clacol_009902 [Clathrus columnatus]
MSFSENYDESLSQNGYLPDHSIHSSNVLFNRAREHSARASMGSARGGTPCYNHKKRPQMIQPLYSFPEPSTTSNDSSTSPDSPVSTRWPNHLSFKRNSGSKRATSSRRYGPINHSSTNDYHRGMTEHLTCTSTDGDDNEEDNVEYSSDNNEPHATSSCSSARQNYPFHISNFKNDHHHHPSDDRPDHSQRGKSNGTRVRDEPCIAVVHGNNKFEAHIYHPHPGQPVLSKAKHSRHRSTHDLFPSIPSLDIAKAPFQNLPQETGGNWSGVPTTTINRPRANTGGGYRVSAPRHPLMSKNTATSYVSTSTLIPPGTLKADSQNMAVAFTSLKINDIDLGISSQKPRSPSRKL